MAGQTLGPLPPYWTIGKAEQLNVKVAMKVPLSGYLGGRPSTGRFIRQLSEDWKEEFNVAYAIPCNSATSGLMAACMAAGVGHGDEVWVSTYTMSATATCAMILGANVRFMDIDPIFFCTGWFMTRNLRRQPPKAVIITNLFGCAADLHMIRSWCDEHHIVMIEDNAQAPYATIAGRYTGTIGHMGVFSLNVHKHIQCGEGGVVVTNDSFLAQGLEDAINHGELRESGKLIMPEFGLNLRMTEPVAAIACAQLKKGFNNVRTRIDLAHALTRIFQETSLVEPPRVREGDRHVYYLWAGKFVGENASAIRAAFVQRVGARGVAFKAGYAHPLHRLFEQDGSFPVTEEMENMRLFTFEICAYNPLWHHLQRMRDIILEEADSLEKELRHVTPPKDPKPRSNRSAINLSGSH